MEGEFRFGTGEDEPIPGVTVSYRIGGLLSSEEVEDVQVVCF